MGTEAIVEFYLLENPSDSGVMRLACRVVEKAWQTGNRVWLLARDGPQGDALDELLWTFSQGSFVPHARRGEDSDAPVVVATEPPDPRDRFDVIVTLHSDPLDEPFHRLRIADIIGAGESEQQQARLRYQVYRDR
ncbi:MAG: DNA polymerase III subunit chi, partial [Proteobacteria bacterium]